MDRKGANTFPFYNLPPEPRAISLRNFSVLLSFPFGENKRRWRLLLPRHFANQRLIVSSRSTDHRTGDSAGDILNVRCTLGLGNNCVINCIPCLLYYCGLLGSSIDPNPDLGIPCLGSIICEGPIRRIPTWVK